MCGYGSFAVFGAGLVGAPIARALRARGAAVLVLVRPCLDLSGGNTTTQALAATLPAGVDVHEIACADDPAQVTKLLVEHRVQVVISTMSAADVGAQCALVSAAHAAGVELFVPSEFGVVTDGAADFVSTMEHLKKIGLPFARFYIGFFMETIPALTGLAINGKINVAGYGNMPCSFTASEDVAGFVAHVLTSLPPEQLLNRTFRLEGDRSTLSDLAQLFGVEVEYVKKVPGKMSEVWTRMQMAAEYGVASTGWDTQLWTEGEEYAGCTNCLWAGHEWTTIKSFYRL